MTQSRRPATPNTTRPTKPKPMNPAPPTNPRSLQVHLWWTAMFVLVALGGAGLAVAADRHQNPVQRPELTWRSDVAAQAWIGLLATDLETVHGKVTDLSAAGRDALGRLQGLDVAGMEEALAAGEPVSSDIAIVVERLQGNSSSAAAQLPHWRLNANTMATFDLVDDAIAAAAELPGYWTALANDARLVGGVVDALARHDEATFAATTAGRETRWADALDLLGQAGGALTEASAARDLLAARGDVATLDDLLGRYRAYDESLVGLYTYMRDDGAQSGPEFEALQDAADQAHLALPADTSALSVIVGEAAGPPITDQLVALEEARGAINEALDNLAGPVE